jgi:hypothetical protein
MDECFKLSGVLANEVGSYQPVENKMKISSAAVGEGKPLSAIAGASADEVVVVIGGFKPEQLDGCNFDR